jgi:DNA-directed RNA polymerase subunit RPC12/RpoP
MAIEHERTEDVTCPFCGYEFDFGRSRDMVEYEDYECEKCKRVFYLASAEKLYTTYGACARYGGEPSHDWQPTVAEGYEKCARCRDVRKVPVPAA